MSVQSEPLELVHPDHATDIEAYLSACRALVLDEIERLLEPGTHCGDLYQLMREYPLRHGKALRPTICIAICRMFGGALNDVLTSAAVLELYHNAFLIHDDVEDGSQIRRTEVTLHQKYGTPVAVNVADGMLAAVMDPLLGNVRTLGVGRALRIMQVISRMARESAEGQMLELSWNHRKTMVPSERDYTRMVYKKTAWYSFVAPAMIGAIAAGVEGGPMRSLTRAMTLLGIAFQIQDDLLNLHGDAQRYGKEINGDLWEGKFTLMLIHALGMSSAAERTEALRILDRRRPTASDQSLQALIVELEASSELSAHGKEALLNAVGAFKTAADVDYLQRLLRRHRTSDHARQFAQRYAQASLRRFQTVFRELPESNHIRFIHSLFSYVMERTK